MIKSLSQAVRCTLIFSKTLPLGTFTWTDLSESMLTSSAPALSKGSLTPKKSKIFPALYPTTELSPTSTLLAPASFAISMRLRTTRGFVVPPVVEGISTPKLGLIRTVSTDFRAGPSPPIKEMASRVIILGSFPLTMETTVCSRFISFSPCRQ